MESVRLEKPVHHWYNEYRPRPDIAVVQTVNTHPVHLALNTCRVLSAVQTESLNVELRKVGKVNKGWVTSINK